MNENDVDDVRDDESPEDKDESTAKPGNLSALADDVAHPFDQTNGIVEGLEGDADDPETINAKQDRQTGIVPGAAPGVGGPVAGIPLATKEGEAEDSDSDEPQGA